MTDLNIAIEQKVAVIPEGNARYMLKRHAGPKGIERTALPAEITSVGRIYFEVTILGHTKTRFRKDTLACADKDDNTSYKIFATQKDAEDYILRYEMVVEIRNMLNQVVWGNNKYDHITKEELQTFLLRLKNQSPNEKEETD